MAAATFSRASSAVISSAVPRAMLSAPSLRATRTKKVLVSFFETLRPKAGRSSSMTVRPVRPSFWLGSPKANRARAGGNAIGSTQLE